MKKLSILLVLVLLGSLVALPIPVKAEGNSSYWVKTYGESDLDEATAVAVAENGDIIVAGLWGATALTLIGGGSLDSDGDVWVLRLDSEGNAKWQKTYGGSNGDLG